MPDLFRNFDCCFTAAFTTVAPLKIQINYRKKEQVTKKTFLRRISIFGIALLDSTPIHKRHKNNKVIKACLDSLTYFRFLSTQC